MPTSPPQRSAPGFWQWTLIVGGIGFAAGFLGPIVLVPDANQGPLLGIFISGPASAALGACLFIVLNVARVGATRQWRALWTVAAIAGLTTLFYALPEPAYEGYVLDATIEACGTPATGADTAIASWVSRVAGVTWAAPRPGWQSDTRRILRDDPGAVLTLADGRSKPVYEGRKPWNRGSIVSEGWRTAPGKTYYATASCAEFPVNSRVRRFARYDAQVQLDRARTDWPPRDAAALLSLETLDSIPAVYQAFSAK